jgi:hypothetical protein
VALQSALHDGLAAFIVLLSTKRTEFGNSFYPLWSELMCIACIGRLEAQASEQFAAFHRARCVHVHGCTHACVSLYANVCYLVGANRLPGS